MSAEGPRIPGGASGLPPVSFDPASEISPFELFRRLREGRPTALYDVRPPLDRPEEATDEGGGAGAPRLTFRGAEPFPGKERIAPGAETVLFDDDGVHARSVARRLRAAGRPRVRALFGGLDLYDFALDPRVVGEERYLEEP